MEHEVSAMTDRWEVRPCKDKLGHTTSFDICLPSKPEDRGVAVVASVYSGEAVANEIAELWNTRPLSPPEPHGMSAEDRMDCYQYGNVSASPPEAEMAELAELRAFKKRVLAAAKFVTPVAPEQIDAAIYADVAGGMSLRNCALKHGLTFGQARGAAKRIALLATKEQP